MQPSNQKEIRDVQCQDNYAKGYSFMKRLKASKPKQVQVSKNKQESKQDEDADESDTKNN